MFCNGQGKILAFAAGRQCVDPAIDRNILPRGGFGPISIEQKLLVFIAPFGHLGIADLMFSDQDTILAEGHFPAIDHCHVVAGRSGQKSIVLKNFTCIAPTRHLGIAPLVFGYGNKISDHWRNPAIDGNHFLGLQ